MIPEYYEFSCPVKIICGYKALSNLHYEMGQMGVSRALVVTDQGVMKAGLMNKVTAALEGSHCTISAVYSETPVDSSTVAVHEVARMYSERGCDCLVAVGGGSCIDTAKGVNIVISEQTEDLMKLQGTDRLTKPMGPLVVIPTTAGTGSEVTMVAVIKDADAGVKMPFMSERLYPKLAVIDPEMTITMPPKVTAATGMDALTHAAEAYYGLQKNPISDAFAAAAVTLIFKNLVSCVESGSDARSRLAMATAAMLAGIAMSNSMTGIVHALSHAVGGICHVPHGVANAIFLPWGMEHNLEKVPHCIGELAPYMGVENVPDQALDRARASVRAVRNLNTRLNQLSGLPLRLREAGVQEHMLEVIARATIDEGPCTYNPEEVTYEGALEILRKAY